MDVEPTERQIPAWIEAAKARGLTGVLATALDALEPLGPLGAQLVYAAQPVLGLWLPREALGEVLKRGFHGRANVEVHVTDGTIFRVTRVVERVEK